MLSRMNCWALQCLMSDAVIVMSLTYVVIYTFFVRSGISKVKMLAAWLSG